MGASTTLTAPTNGGVLFGDTRIDDPRVVISASRAAHRKQVTPAAVALTTQGSQMASPEMTPVSPFIRINTSM
jgi:hypothetical protein